MAKRSPTSFPDKAANWILAQSWMVLAVIAVLCVGASVAVGSFAPANLIGTRLVANPEPSRINYSAEAVPVIPATASVASRSGSYLRADVTDGEGEVIQDEPAAEQIVEDQPTAEPEIPGGDGGSSPEPEVPADPCAGQEGREGCPCRSSAPACNGTLVCGADNKCSEPAVQPPSVPQVEEPSALDQCIAACIEAAAIGGTLVEEVCTCTQADPDTLADPPVVATCGNGTLDEGEECDSTDRELCAADCTLPAVTSGTSEERIICGGTECPAGVTSCVTTDDGTEECSTAHGTANLVAPVEPHCCLANGSEGAATPLLGEDGVVTSYSCDEGTLSTEACPTSGTQNPTTPPPVDPILDADGNPSCPDNSQYYDPNDKKCKVDDRCAVGQYFNTEIDACEDLRECPPEGEDGGTSVSFLDWLTGSLKADIGVNRKQPCITGGLANCTLGNRCCTTAQLKDCANQNGQGCFISPSDNAPTCRDISNAENECLDSTGKPKSCPSGQGCNACTGKCENVKKCADGSEPNAAGICPDGSTPNTDRCTSPKQYSIQLLMCVDPISCRELCGRSGLTCLTDSTNPDNSQCIQDRCTGRVCPTGSTCNTNTGICDGAPAAQQYGTVTDACNLFDVNCGSGAHCETSTSTTDLNAKAVCVNDSTGAKTNFNPCDTSISTNRACPPETVCKEVNGYAECQIPVNSSCNEGIDCAGYDTDPTKKTADCYALTGTSRKECRPVAGSVSNAYCKDVAGVTGESIVACPTSTYCADDGKCKSIYNNCRTDSDCASRCMGLAVCTKAAGAATGTCQFDSAHVDTCYALDLISNPIKNNVSSSEVVCIAGGVQGKSCNQTALNRVCTQADVAKKICTQDEVNRGVKAYESALANIKPSNVQTGTGFTVPDWLGARTGSGAGSLYDLYLQQSKTASGGTIVGSGSSIPSSLAPERCVKTCSIPGMWGFKKASGDCECRYPTMADYAQGLGNATQLNLCNTHVNLSSEGMFTWNGVGALNLNTSQSAISIARENWNLPCIADGQVFCGKNNVDITGCYQQSTDGLHNNVTTKYIGDQAGANCHPEKADKCVPDLAAMKALAGEEGGECPAQPITKGVSAGLYQQTVNKFQATLALGVTCSLQIWNGCPGAGKTIKFKMSDFELPPAQSSCNGTNCVKGDDGQIYGMGRGGVYPIGAYCGYGDSTGIPASTTDSTKLPMCNDENIIRQQPQCKFPIHPWYVTTRTYPDLTSDGKFAVFGGASGLLPKSGCWKIEEYMSTANDPWGASLIDANITVEVDQQGFLSRLWDWIKGWFGYGTPSDMVATVQFPDGRVLKTAIPPECMDTTKIGIGQKNRTGTAAGTGVNNRLPQCRALLGLDGATYAAYSGDSMGAAVNSAFGTTPPIIPGRRYYAAPTCSGSGPSPLHPDYHAPTPTPTSGPTSTPRPSASPSSSASPAACGSSCPAGQCKQIEGYGPFCVSLNSCASAPSPCGAGKHMCVTDEGQWSCTTAALRPAGATCVVCDGSTATPTPTSTPRPSASPTSSASPRPTASSGVVSLSIAMADRFPASIPTDITVCAKDANGRTVTSYRGKIVIYVAEDTPYSFLANLPQYAFTAADNGCHAFPGGIKIVFPGESTVVAVDVDSDAEIYGLKTVEAFIPTSPSPGASATPVPSGSPVTQCPQDLKLCPDGSYVGRTRPACQFAACPTPGNSNTNSVACSAEAKLCPDGSVVSRVKPNCEFAACQKVLGDVNGDGRITIVDVVMITDFLSGKPGVTLSSEQFLLADVTCDRLLNLADVAKIANFIVTGTDGASRTLTCGPTR